MELTDGAAKASAGKSAERDRQRQRSEACAPKPTNRTEVSDANHVGRTEKVLAAEIRLDAVEDENDDDSLVLLAQRMDDATSIVSDVTAPVILAKRMDDASVVSDITMPAELSQTENQDRSTHHEKNTSRPLASLPEARVAAPSPEPSRDPPQEVGRFETRSRALSRSRKCIHRDEDTAAHDQSGEATVEVSPRHGGRISRRASGAVAEAEPHRRGSRKKHQKAPPSASDVAPAGRGRVPVESTNGGKAASKISDRRLKRGRKKTPPKHLDGDSDEEPMRGTGFNTRIRDDPKFDCNLKPNPIAEQVSPCQRAPQHPDAPHETSNLENPIVGCGSSEHDDLSFYDSDEETQVFYESTDDDSDLGEENLAGAGTSVADAVKGLNKQRAVAKVKNLFGI